MEGYSSQFGAYTTPYKHGMHALSAPLARRNHA